MVRPLRPVTAILLSFALLGCAGTTGPGTTRDTGQAVTGNPAADVRYFQAALERDPDNPAHRRGLAEAYARSADLDGARDAYLALIAAEVANADDRIALASVYLRQQDLAGATNVLSVLPQDVGGARRFLVEGMIADRNEDWTGADGAYARAVKDSASPAQALNNWGMSRLARGDMAAAERTLAEAAAADPNLFIASNNLGIVRAMQGQYRAPATRLSDADRARLLYNMGLVAETRGDTEAARRLFRAASDAHPRHYPAAAERMARLDG